MRNRGGLPAFLRRRFNMTGALFRLTMKALRSADSFVGYGNPVLAEEECEAARVCLPVRIRFSALPAPKGILRLAGLQCSGNLLY